MNTLQFWMDDFTGLFFPKLCAGCASSLYRNEVLICTRCRYHLPRTGFHLWRDNPVEMLFWGRVPVEYATAGFFFQKKGRFQRIIHTMKYKGVKEIGKELGKMMGHEMNGSIFSRIDCIIPVPLHPEKLKTRGFNQSEWIARGLSEALHRPVYTDILIRAVKNETQTRKSRYERWKNVENIFQVTAPSALENRHVLLVDDVVTTGSTLEACASELLKVTRVKVSIATLAVA